ncbi:hypothetical protein P154DRAFT_543352 [Amniculicola lignicola CBS 123094]|uniref:Ubiquitin interaction motif protein n=1 Tax=Amniculicola lignicola CBS 123094 TaxID=1392246 RepID=A0A6A5WZM7_9PLEO|nr:hypothetical protein P154DRAFT_543352 [Amniculicola lignicola CBS 123094]
MTAADLEENAQMLAQLVDGQLSHAQAVKFLKISDYNLEAAINKFYDQGLGAISQNLGWDGSAFGADRYGQQDDSNTKVPTFTIDYATGFDNYPHSSAPSRPPSRNSHHSAASSAHMGDAPIQSVENTQESGVIGNAAPVFGPATKESYEANNWALVTTTKSAEYIPDAVASRRKREEGGPVIIKPLPNSDYLPALLAILHSIPLFRNALLAPELPLQTYRLRDDWWSGHATAAALTVDGASIGDAYDLSIIHELQRLMAFLDNSERAYGSVGGLFQLEAWTSERYPRANDDSDVLRFFLTWSRAYENQAPQAQLDGVFRSSVIACGQREDFFILNTIVVRDDSTRDITLYDVLDSELRGNPSQSAYIVDISNVLVFNIKAAKSDATGLDIKIPATLYADRYLESTKQDVDAMFSEMRQYEKQLTDIDSEAAKVKYHKTPNGDKVESLALLKSGMKAFELTENDLIEDPRNTSALAELQSYYDYIERKLEIFEDQKNQIRKLLDSISHRYKGPIDDGTETVMDITADSNAHSTQYTPTHAYKLVGVSTRPSVYYLLHPDTSSNIPDAKQWWRIEYSTATSEAVILRERLTLSQVIQQATSEHKSALFVYANDAATSVPEIPLPEPLVKFVQQDNIAFIRELSSDYPEEEGAGGIEPFGGWNERGDDHVDWKNHQKPDWDLGGRAGGGGGKGYDWNTASAREFHEYHADSGLSSQTLTPRTDMDEEINMMGAQEMREVGVKETHEHGGGVEAWAGMSNASSETVGGDVVMESQASRADVEMVDVNLEEEPSVQHIEVKEEEIRKGG